jgi:Flp pilus assembly protein TadG
MPTNMIRQFGRDQRGGVLVLVALMVPVLFGLSAAAMDYAFLVKRRTELQRAADSASIAGVNQFKLANTDDATAIRIAVSMANSQAKTSSAQASAPKVAAEVLGNHASVHVTVTEVVPLNFAKLLQLPDITISVTSTAKLSGSTRLCLLTLDPKAAKALSLEKNARLTAADCSIYSNSTDPAGISGGDLATATAITTCSAGGFSGSKALFLPPPATGCPPLKDPLASRPAPQSLPCIVVNTFSNLNAGDTTKPVTIAQGYVTLDPGTYCAGLRITGTAQVTLRPGIYTMNNGPLIVDQKGSMTGTDVGFFFTGDKGGLLFDKDSTISLSAPHDGVMAGLLMFEQRTVSAPVPPPPPLSLKGPPPPGPVPTTPVRQYRIISDNARNLLGTIYLPAGQLIIDAKNPVADQSAYTVIVARLVNLYDGPNLVLNARYANSDVPVPDGVGPSSADTKLTQ